MNTVHSPARSLRPASLTAGISLLLMAVLAIFGNFVAVESLTTPGDAAQTAADVTAAESTFRWGVAALVAVVILDLIVAAALFRVFASVDRTVSMTAAWVRVAYSAAFLVAIGQLALVPERLDEPERALASIEEFGALWNIGLGVFGVHLLLIGWLAYRAAFMPKILGLLLAVAAAGYLVDGFGTIVVRDYGLDLAMYTFLGEIVLLIWLLAKGTRTTVEE
ncbi:DUF4386 domain-containing protein [Glycomyces xiaoerkulensis]|uniref:DUF4386 domain-containing protein n=1 Tax=Glycomyces xiaoerkulensis TaxID=2038139 RepID=UPI000C265465|nr:DUF4386 domain-containing protein [Glycomyces xiaoerkulensis]